jgi:hypothetical protein
VGRINSGELINWQNGNIMTAEKLKQDREVIVTAINDNYEKIIDIQQSTLLSKVEDYTRTLTVDVSNYVFNLPEGKSYVVGENVLRVVVEGFELANTDDVQEFEEINETSFRINGDLTAGTTIFASWSQIRTVKALSEDVAVFNVMGVF